MRILYLEDNPVDADLARRALARNAPDIALDIVATLAAARAQLAPAAPPYDLFLSDLRLPDGSGLELLAEVRARGLDIAVVMITGSGDQAAAIAALKAGADDYLVKHDDYRQQLVPTLKAALARFRAESARKSRHLRVLYAEHNPFDIDLARRHLAQHAPHISVDAVASGEDVLARLPESPADAPAYDVVLLDYQLPGASALEITKVLRDQRGLDLPVVLVTAQGGEEVVGEALRLGVSSYLVKHAGYLAELPATLEHAHSHAQLRREQRALQTTTARLQQLLAASPTILYALRADGGRLTPVWVSDNMTRVMGYTAAECLAPDWWLMHVHDEDRARMQAGLAGIFAAGTQVLEYRFHDRTGGVHWLRDDMRLLHDADGKATEVVGCWSDISAGHAAEERQRLNAAALDSTRDAVIITDLEVRILAVNPAFTEITGYTEAEVLGQNPRLLHANHHDRTFYQAVWASLLESGHWQGEVWNRRKNGEAYPQWLTLSTVRDEHGDATHYVGVATDLTRLRSSEEKLDHLAHHDPLTDLPNRLLVQSLLQNSLEQAQRQERQVGVLFINLDRFKTVNDSLGHAHGDELLVAVARRLRERLRGEDILGRLGGDEFVAVLGMLQDPLDAESIARDLLAVLDAPFLLPDGHEACVRASVGVSSYPRDGTTAQDLVHRADAAMRRAKECGGAQFACYTSDLGAGANARFEIEEGLRRALTQGEFVLHYQPKVDLASGKIIGAEALLRWLRPGNDPVGPMEFIPLAEKSGQIVAIGAWVIDEACRQLRAWADAGLAGVQVAVNVSARQFRSDGLEATITGALERHGVKPQQLELELTESMLMEAPGRAIERLAGLKRIGIKLSLDDFGTGYSSLAYLSRFPMDQLKIDRSFVVDIVTDPNAANIANSIIALAHRMQLKVVAEGVETEAQLGYLRRNHCDQMQGYYFSRPLPAEDFATMLHQDKSLPVTADAAGLRTLLVVDDEANILSAIRRTLRGEGYRVLTATSARAGLELLGSNAVQVILSDQRMPEISGTEFLGRVKMMHPNTVRIVISGYTQLETIIDAVNAGALYKFLTKPWDDDQLREHVRDAFRYYEAIIKPRELADSTPLSAG